MAKKYVKTEFDKERDEDILQIRKLVKDIFGVSISRPIAIGIWSAYSEEICAGWVTVNRAGVARAFTRYGPFQEIDNMLAQIKEMEPEFRVLLLNKLDGKYCLRCGRISYAFCEHCDKDELDGVRKQEEDDDKDLDVYDSYS